jgi:hypothetical protein
MTQLAEKANDSEMALGSDVMEYALFQYGFLSAMGPGPGWTTCMRNSGSVSPRNPQPRHPPRQPQRPQPSPASQKTVKKS